jgi:hypothetical protein
MFVTLYFNIVYELVVIHVIIIKPYMFRLMTYVGRILSFE